jgi:hypothetical protein
MPQELIIGNYIDNVQCILYLDPSTNRKRVKTIGNGSVPDGILIECNKDNSNEHSVGTFFTTESIKICKKPDGRIYGRAKDQMIYPKQP